MNTPNGSDTQDSESPKNELLERGGPLPTLPTGCHPGLASAIQQARSMVNDGEDEMAVAAGFIRAASKASFGMSDIAIGVGYLLKAASSRASSMAHNPKAFRRT